MPVSCDRGPGLAHCGYMCPRRSCLSCARLWIGFALAAALVSCTAAPLGPGGTPPLGATNPCSFVIPGPVVDRVDQNAHLRLTNTYWGDAGFKLGVTCIHDPPGSQQSSSSEIDVALYDGLRDYVVGGDSPDWGYIVLGSPSTGGYVKLATADQDPGMCTVSVTMGPSTAPKVGDRIEATFHCEAIETSSGALVDVRDGVLSGTLEYVE